MATLASRRLSFVEYGSRSVGTAFRDVSDGNFYNHRTIHTDEDTLELLRRLAEHYPDAVIAGILNRQGRRSATGQPMRARHEPRPLPGLPLPGAPTRACGPRAGLAKGVSSDGG
jgi:hypothetical protein